jgi:hypothetical protein
MKKKYYVNTNAQSNGDNEVHVEGCRYMPASENRKSLGEYSNCHDAVKEAKREYKKANGCYYCCNDCHTS